MEQVFVVAREAFFDGAWPQGLLRFDSRDAARQLLDAFEQHGFWADRDEAEQEPAWQQLIPYCAITNPRGDRVLTVERLAAQGEARLHGRLSIGIGGHVNPPDHDAATGTRHGLLARALRRELVEEVALDGASLEAGTLRFLGLIKDDATPVGAVHAGLAFRLAIDDVASRTLTIRETDKMRGSFWPIRAVARERARLESWSSLLVDTLDADARPISGTAADESAST